MALVCVPHSRSPIFPPWCPVCGHDCGEQKIKVRAVAWSTMSPHLKNLGPLCWLKLPGCKSCGRRLLLATYGRRLAFFACAGAGIAFVGRHIGWDNMRQAKGLFLLGAGAFTLPFIYWQLLHPHPVELSIDEDELTFTIVRDDYALEFADLNGCKAFDLSSEFEQFP